MRSRIPDAIIVAFANLLQKKINEYRERAGYTHVIHDRAYEVKHKTGLKYDKLNVGDSGKFMFDNGTGLLYFIEGYGRVNKKKCFGNLIEILNSPDTWWFDGYSICDKGAVTACGFATPITIDIKEEDGRVMGYESCDICGGDLTQVDIDQRQEWVEEQYHCEECDIDFTKRTEYHLHTSIPAVIEMTRDWNIVDDEELSGDITIYRHEYNVNGYDKKPQKFEDVFKDGREYNHEEIMRLMNDRVLSIEKVIDAVIRENAIIGVGLVSLADHLRQYVMDKI